MRKYHGKEMYLKAKRALARKERLLELIGNGATEHELKKAGYNFSSPKNDVSLHRG